MVEEEVRFGWERQKGRESKLLLAAAAAIYVVRLRVRSRPREKSAGPRPTELQKDDRPSGLTTKKSTCKKPTNSGQLCSKKSQGGRSKKPTKGANAQG
ncbi:hypothetical protein Nepgr_019094 [Nepenthes gracilis]|uniref:Uncharacterized protein n=1 Tax=Nepenthes gracilis TaxID=150966 RepID=A0AAD3SSL3_NEPGR|nr:hypothetical protein Nepgr_019094 [Nepenthes gracilis]